MSPIWVAILGVLAGLGNGFGVALQIMIPRYFAQKHGYERDTMLVYGFLGAVMVVVASLGSTALNSIKEKINSIKSSPQPALVKEEGTE